MGFWDTLFSDREKTRQRSDQTQKSEQRTKQTEEQTRARTATGRRTETGERTDRTTGTTAGTSTAETTATRSLLGEAELGLLRNLTARIGESVETEGAGGAAAGRLLDRGVELGGDIDNIIAGLQDAARANFARTTGREVAQFASDRVGSELNTISEQARGLAASDLESRLAGIAAETELAGLGLERDFLSESGRVGGTPISQLEDVVGLLRGAIEETTGAQVATEEQEQTLNTLVQQLTEAETEEEQNETMRAILDSLTNTTATATSNVTSRSQSNPSAMSHLTNFMSSFADLLKGFGSLPQ